VGRLVGEVTKGHDHTNPRPATPRRGWLVQGALRTLAPAGALVLVALCLRGPFSAVAPLIAPLRAQYLLSTGAVAVLTALPLVCFAVLSPVAPTLARRLGVHRAVLLAVAVLGVGVALRLGGVAGLFAGTVLLAGAIAVVNVLLPALVRAEYGPRSPAVLGATTGAIALSASLGAGLALPLADVTGSARTSLSPWFVAVLAAAVTAILTATVGRTITNQPARFRLGSRL